MILPALLLACAAPASAVPAAEAVRLEAALSVSVTARRLLVADAEVPRAEPPSSRLPRAVDVRGGRRPEIVLDLARLRRAPRAEALAEYARALAVAAIAAPLPLVEAEQAERQWTARVLVETAAEDPELSRALDAALKRPDARAPELSRAAAFLRLFADDPAAAYWSVESSARGAARLTDLEDFYAQRGRALRSLKAVPPGPYAVLDGRRYPSARVRAALAVRGGGELTRLREALGSYDSVGVAPLRDAYARWRRGQSKPR
jgi:hypothetical protein